MTRRRAGTTGAVSIITGLLTQTAPAAAGPTDIVISEIRIAQPGPDTDEYFELRGPPGASLDGVTYIVIGDGAGADGTIEGATSLTGLSLRDDGLFLAGESREVLGAEVDLITMLDFENGDNVTHLLVFEFTGSVGDDLDLDDDCTLDVTPWEAVIDLIALVEEQNPPVETECHYGPPAVGPTPDVAVPSHVYRCEPFGTWTMGSADPVGGADSPGAANPGCGDVDADGAVGITDLLLLLSAWGACPDPPKGCPADFDGDGIVGDTDLLTLLSNWT